MFHADKKNSGHIERCDLTDLESQVLDSEKKLIIKPYSFWKNRDMNERRYFMYVHGIYVLPTTELIEWLRTMIIGNAIEIGAGHGAIARSLNIPITDSRMQELPEVKFMYQMGGQPPIVYHNDIEKLDAIEAVEKYKPDTVIGAFITHKYDEKIGSGNMYGVDELKMIKKIKRRYINIGNKHTHRDKPLLKLPHTEYQFDWLITRSVDQYQNVIFVFDKAAIEL